MKVQALDLVTQSELVKVQALDLANHPVMNLETMPPVLNLVTQSELVKVQALGLVLLTSLMKVQALDLANHPVMNLVTGQLLHHDGDLNCDHRRDHCPDVNHGYRDQVGLIPVKFYPYCQPH